MQKFALIGKTLKHSYSKKIHSLLSSYNYDLVELESGELKDFVLKKEYKGFNVTIPYKKEIIALLDEVDERAKKIGAVNTVVCRDGKLLGYNTDFDGMVYALKSADIEIKDKNILILGSGGTSNTARAVAEFLGAKDIKILSRKGEINYENYSERASGAQVVINTTPVGMYPDNYSCRVDLKCFEYLEGVLDVVYNPAMTMLLKQAKDLGVNHTNGLPMLVAQAKFASEIFLDKKLDDNLTEDIIKKLSKESQNLVLIGMPGSGKTTIGKKLAQILEKEFIDTDALIEQKAGKTIPEIFAEYGEEYFRKLESQVLMEVGVLSNKVISTGGGVVKNKENYFSLKQNGVIFWLQRDINLLASDNRPLSKDKQAIQNLYDERKDLYSCFADGKVSNDSDIDSIANKVVKFYENFSN